MYQVKFEIGDKKLKMELDARDELDAIDMLKSKIKIIGIEKAEAKSREELEFEGIIREAIWADPRLTSEDKEAYIRIVCKLSDTSEKRHQVVKSIMEKVQLLFQTNDK